MLGGSRVANVRNYAAGVVTSAEMCLTCSYCGMVSTRSSRERTVTHFRKTAR
jgi:hypothetical protein